MKKHLTILLAGCALACISGFAQDTPGESSGITDTVFYCRFNSDTEDNYATQDWTTMNNTWEIIDHNNDGSTWYFMRGKGSDDDADAQFLGMYFGAWVEYNYNYTNAADDYLVLKNPLSLNAGTNFVSFCYKTQYGPGKYVENVALLYGKDRDVSTMDTLINLPGIGTSKTWEITTSQLELEENGDYYFAFVGYSNPNCGKLYLDNFLVGFSEVIQPADLVVENVFLPASDCGLSAETPIQVSLANTGLNEITKIGLSYTVNEEEPVFEEFSFDPALAISGRDTVTFATPADFSTEGTVYNVTVEGYVIPQGNEVPETDSTNNTASASTENFAPVDLPFESRFTSLEACSDWNFDDEQWGFSSGSEGTSYLWARSGNHGSPLQSRCVELTEGVTYSFSFDYKAGFVASGGYNTNATFVVKYGQNGTPVEEWDTLMNFNRLYTSEAWTNSEEWFLCEQSGIYSIAIVPVETGGSLWISGTLLEVIPDQIFNFTAFNGGIAPLMPAEQVNGTFNTEVEITNIGAKEITGLSVNILREGETVGTATMDIPVGESLKQQVPVTLSGIAPGDSIILSASANLPEQEAVAAPQISRSLATDTLMQYDQTTRFDRFLSNSGNNSAGIVFELKQQDTLSAVSVGWAMGNNAEISIAIHHWDAENTNIDGLLYEGRFDWGLDAGHIQYPMPSIVLEAGQYLISVGYEGTGLLYDSIIGPTMYALVSGQVVPMTTLGLPAIRGIFGHHTHPALLDATVEAIPLPADAGLFAQNEPITVRVANNGQDSATIPVYVMIDKNEPMSQTVTIPAYGNQTLSFTGDLSTAGEHLITAWTGLEGDENHSNDTLTRSVTCSEVADPYVMDFEQCQDFALTNLNPAWTSLDRDGSPTYGFEEFSFPHSTEAFGFIVFNPEQTTPALTTGEYFPYQGFRYGAAFFAGEGANDDWLISPKLSLPAEGAQMSFAVKSLTDAVGMEQYNVLVSATDNDPESFVQIGETYEAPASDWEEVTINLSDYAGKEVYLAIQCVTPSDQAFIFMIDDIRVSKPAGNLGSDLSTQLSVYPNPATEMVCIRSTDARILQVSICNAQGTEVYQSGSMDSNEFRCNVSKLAPGAYFARVETAMGCSTLKFFIL